VGAQPDFKARFQDFHDIFGEFFGFEICSARAVAAGAAADVASSGRGFAL